MAQDSNNDVLTDGPALSKIMEEVAKHEEAIKAEKEKLKDKPEEKEFDEYLNIDDSQDNFEFEDYLTDEVSGFGTD